jgi:hypothetical protein
MTQDTIYKFLIAVSYWSVLLKAFSSAQRTTP